MLRAGVCVVGAGPAGLTLAELLAEAGHEVLIVESGGRTPPPGGSHYNSTTSVGTYYPLLTSRARGVGGSANHWDFTTVLGVPSLRLHELDEIDFEARPGVRDLGWPYGRSALDADYRRARELFDVGPLEPEPEAGLDGPVQRRIYSYGRASTFTQTIPRRLAGRPNVRLLPDVVAVDLRTDTDQGEVSALRCTGVAGTSFSVEASYFVLAGGGIENARLLLASRSVAPRGLGNHSDHVGRWFNEHPHHGSAVVVPADGRLAQDRASWSFVSKQGRVAHSMYALSEACLRAEGLLNTAFFLTPRPPRSPVPLTNDGQIDLPVLVAARQLRSAVARRQWSPDVRRSLRTTLATSPKLVRMMLQQSAAQRADAAGRTPRVPSLLTLVGMNEQQPRRDSRVQLTAKFDDVGMPEAELDWRSSPFDHESMRSTIALLAPGLGRVLGASLSSLLSMGALPAITQGYHHMGTTRMTDSPADGVVDRDGRVHGMRNLYVAGSSVFPSSGAANPTLTIVALAVRLAAHLQTRLAGPLLPIAGRQLD